MGLLDDYGIDTDNIEAPNYEKEDGWYDFTIGDVFIKEGSQNNPDTTWLIIKYLLEDEDGNSKGEVSDMFTLPADPANPTDKEQERLGWYVKRMLDFGFARNEINDIESDDLIGLRGALELKTKRAKNGNDYQNIAKVRMAPQEPVAEAPKAKAAPKATRPAARAGATRTAPGNPFAGK